MKKKICKLIAAILTAAMIFPAGVYAEETEDFDVFSMEEPLMTGEEWVGLLPIGSIVLLKEGEKKIMVIGYLQSLEDGDGTVYDYSACLFPEGYLGAEEVYLFNQDQIENIYYIGYQDREQIDYMEKISQYKETK